MNPLTPYPLAPIGSFIGFILSIVPLASHLGFQSWNVGIWVYAFWIGTMNVVNFVNTIVWHDNVNIVIPVWCDIVTKLQTGAAIGVPACALVLCLHLFKITRMRAVVLVDEKAQRRRSLVYDLALTLGVPLLVMALWIIVQPYRFNIDEELGCQSVAYSYITYIIYYPPQLVFCLAVAVITPVTLQKFIRYRREMNEVLTHHSDQDVTPSKYIRVMIITCLSSLLDLSVLIVLIIQIVSHITEGPFSTWNYPYQSWAFVHDGSIKEIIQTDVEIWRSQKWQMFSIKWNEWVYVLHAIIFFGTFGTTPKARRRYYAAMRCVIEKFGMKKEKSLEKDASNIIFNSNPPCPKPARRETFSFLTSTNTAEDHLTVTVSVGSIEDRGGIAIDAFRPAATIPEEPSDDSASNLKC